MPQILTLRAYRKAHKLSYDDLAALMNISVKGVGMFLRKNYQELEVREDVIDGKVVLLRRNPRWIHGRADNHK